MDPAGTEPAGMDRIPLWVCAAGSPSCYTKHVPRSRIWGGRVPSHWYTRHVVSEAAGFPPGTLNTSRAVVSEALAPLPHLLHFSICLTLRQIGLCSPFWGGMFSPWYSKHVPCRGGGCLQPPPLPKPTLYTDLRHANGALFCKNCLFTPPPLWARSSNVCGV